MTNTDTGKPLALQAPQQDKLPERSISMMDQTGFPLGLVIGRASHKDMLDTYNRLTEAEKEQFIFECKDAKSQSEIDEVINRFSGHLF